MPAYLKRNIHQRQDARLALLRNKLFQPRHHGRARAARVEDW